MYQLTVLDNKLKVITHRLPYLHGVTAAVFVGTGSRYESNKMAGISHFVEHMLFKGTSKRPTPADISRAIEGMGGYTNAATSQDYTFFYNRVPAKNSQAALEVLADMLINSLFDEQAIEREKGVILEELNMYLDSPTKHIYDLIMQAAFPGNSLGRDIIGTPKTIRSFRRRDFMDYLNQTYQPRNMVISLSGRVSHQQIVKQVRQLFGSLRNSLSRLRYQPVSSRQTKPHLNILTKKTDQAHLALAVPSLPRGHKDEAILSVLEAILGMGMSSRLFLEVREKKGLCYYIHTFNEKFADTGLLGIAAGLNLSKLNEAVAAILNELKKIKQQPVTAAELDRAKEYLRGNLSLQLDNTDQMAIWYGSQALFNKHVVSLEEKIKRLLAVKQNDRMKLARKIFVKQAVNLAVIGPLQQTRHTQLLKIIKNSL